MFLSFIDSSVELTVVVEPSTVRLPIILISCCVVILLNTTSALLSVENTPVVEL